MHSSYGVIWMEKCVGDKMSSDVRLLEPQLY